MIKKYIRKIIKEILAEPELQMDYSKYKIKNVKTSSFRDSIFIFEDPMFKFTIKYRDEINHAREYSIDLGGISDLNHTVNDDYKKYLQSDLRAIKEITLYMHYNYKNERGVEIHTFTDWDKTYRPDILGEVFQEVKDWIIARPEYLI